MKPDGVIAFHVSNRFLDLKPVVANVGRQIGVAYGVIAQSDDDGSTVSDWVLLTREKSLLFKPEILDSTYIIPPQPGWRLWTG